MGHGKVRTWLVTSEYMCFFPLYFFYIIWVIGWICVVTSACRGYLCTSSWLSRLPSASSWFCGSRSRGTLKRLNATCIIDQNNQYFNQVGKPRQVPRLGCVTRLGKTKQKEEKNSIHLSLWPSLLSSSSSSPRSTSSLLATTLEMQKTRPSCQIFHTFSYCFIRASIREVFRPVSYLSLFNFFFRSATFKGWCMLI